MADAGNIRAGAGGAGIGAVTALALMFQLTPVWEGRKLDPYRDVIGKWTVCEGETRVEMRHYTDAECNAMSERAYREHLEFVASVMPGIRAWPFQHAAYADTAYNIGKGAFARSSMVTEFRARHYRQACRAILKYKFAGKQIVPGLELRRTGDAARIGSYEMCLGDAVAAELQARTP